jgi:hypothetical protein
MFKMPAKLVSCASAGCADKRRHYESDEPRGIQMLEVPYDFLGKAYCSIECFEYGKKELDKPKEM